jgi:hypothetical protein
MKGGRSPGEHVSTARIHDALDGLLNAAELERIEAHLQLCAPCRQEYAGLSESVRALRSLPQAARPPEDVWSAVASRIGAAADSPPAEQARVVPLPAVVRAARRFALSARELVAAAVVVSMLSAGTTWLTMGGPRSAGPAVVPASPSSVAGTPAGPAARVVSSEGARYADAVDRLERILVAGRGVLGPETLLSIEQSLGTVDAAIADIEEALVADPGSDMLRRMLSAHRSTRLGVLQRAAAAVQAEI